MYKKKIFVRHILSAVLIAVIAIPLLAGIMARDMSVTQAATTLSNPRRGSNGVVTWDCVYFGRYPQSDATGVKSDPIKWRVLSVNGNDAFLVADCNLDAQYYNDAFEKITWETSLIRSWLNGYGSSSNASKVDYSKENFIDKAFGAAEQNAILTTTVTNPGNAYYNTSGGNSTKDKVFLLSYEEVTNSAYGFSSDAAKEDPAKTRANTAYVGAGGSTDSPLVKPAGENDVWWLRTPGRFSNNTIYVGRAGSVEYPKGYWVDNRYPVCPALHLNLSASTLWSYAGTVGSDGSSTKGDTPPAADTTVQAPSSGATYLPTDSKSSNKTVEYYQAPENGSTTVKVPAKVTINGTTYTVTSVADNAFKNNKTIKKVIIGSNVKTIGANAFMGCTNLQTVTIGKNVTTIKSKAFYNCTNLRKVTMGKNVTTIKSKAFYKCTKLTTITIPSKVTTIGQQAFYKCTSLKKITIPSKVKKIGAKAFYGCKKLKTITIKTTKLTSKRVGSKAFKGIYSKAAIKVPKTKLTAYKKILRSKGVGSKARIK